MKVFYTLFLFMFGAISLFAQSARITDLEKAMSKKSGETYLRDAITLSSWYYDEGFFEKSADWADKAYSAAKKEKLANWMAIALSQEGKAQMKIPSRRNAARNKAFKNFEESNSRTTDSQLRMDNLQNMREIAMALDKRKELEVIMKDIAILESQGIKWTEAPEDKGLFSIQQAELEKAKETAVKNEQLSAKVDNLSLEQQKLKEQQELLQSKVKAREVAIQNMSAEQIKQELLLSEQGRILDSMQFTGILDSLHIAQQQMLVEQTATELDQQKAETQLQKSQRNLLLAVGGIIALLALGLYHRYHTVRRHHDVLSEKNKIIEEERRRSEELLLNILPKAVADELKANGMAIAHPFENVSVLFTDFEGFSRISKLLTPAQLVSDLDYAFKNFDRIVGANKLEKIKTIGDAYMCAGGIPAKDSEHPARVVQAALEIQEFLHEWNQDKVKRGEPPFKARIGIHTGPIVAGVVGSRKFAYDIWGDTVNIAARMEGASEPGKVNISATTFSLVKNDFSCEYRGKIPAKNVGEIEMYYVKKNV